jgi:hypothetical protein
MSAGLALGSGIFHGMVPVILNDRGSAGYLRSTGKDTTGSKTGDVNPSESATQVGSKSNAAESLYSSTRTSSGVPSESSTSSVRASAAGEFSPRTSISRASSIRTNGTTTSTPSTTKWSQSRPLISELPQSEPGSIAAARDLVKFVGVDRANDVSVCLRTLSPFLQKVEAGETGRGRYLRERDLHGEAQKQIFHFVKLYATRKMQTKVLTRKPGKSKKEVGRKLDLLEVQVSCDWWAVGWPLVGRSLGERGMF